MNEFSAIVLAAGKGRRMNSNTAKVLHLLCGMPLIYYPLKELVSLKKYIKQIIIVVGYKGKIVEREVRGFLNIPLFYPVKKNIEFVYQKRLLGTADAVKIAIKKVKYENILIICADTPFIKKETLFSLIENYIKNKDICSILTAKIKYNNELGKIIRDEDGEIMAIKEQIDLDKNQKDREFLYEANSGIYVFNKEVLLSNLEKITINHKKKEYFLTDIISILYNEGFKIKSYSPKETEEILGINTKKDLLTIEGLMRKRIIQNLLSCGVFLMDENSTFIQEGVKIGKDTIIYPFTFIEKNVIIGKNCSIGPFIHIREGTKISSNTQLGNFVEVVRCRIGKEVKVKHFSYLGDATLKDRVNIGAGTVIANFDGKKKNKTIIGKNAFIGSDTVLVAPVKIGKSAFTGAGSVVTKDVKPKSVVVGVPAKFLKKRV